MNLAATAIAALMLAACTQVETDKQAAPEQSAEKSEQAPNGVASTASQAASSGSASSVQQEAVTPASACLTQDGEELQLQAVKAIGTEPFWGARTEGRCVTYSTPEDQKGTRIWTHVDTGPQGSVWNGALRGRQFQLSVKTSPGCSDGMSDRTYPLEAVLRVDGETRHGCAEPL